MIGRTLSHYRVTAALGAGGMGEVYRATDTTLGREVAIKVLPPEVASDPERLARFKREAHVLASLNHPHIAAIHGLEEADGTPFLALELVEGEDLKARLARGAIPVGEALEIAKQVAEALEEAHNKGIVHRDLKPANVKLTPDGQAKVLDFGLAKAWAGDAQGGSSASSALSQSPTLAHTGTVAGVILGTAAYMSPEQARGKPVDKRADVWSFGVLLWEMLTGRALFAGDTVTDVIAAVVTKEPDLTAVPQSTPPSVKRLLSRCLRKDPRQRLPDIGAARLDLQEALAGPSGGADAENLVTGTTTASRARERWAWVAAALLAGAAAFLVGQRLSRTHEPPRPPAHFVLDAPADTTFWEYSPVAMSPDGRHVVSTVTVAGGERQLWIRSLGSPEARPLANTDGALGAHFWSPDSSSLAFAQDGELRKLALAGGTIQRICTLPAGFNGGVWGQDGTIVIAAGNANAGLYAVSQSGGEVRKLSTPDASKGETSHNWPVFLPDGRLLFVVAGGAEAGLHVASMDAPAAKRRIRPEFSRFQFVAPGYLLYAPDNILLAQRVDPRELRAQGEAVPLASSLASFNQVRAWSWFSASNTGQVAWLSARSPNLRLQWIDRRGRDFEALGAPAEYGQVALSPDDKRVVVEVVGAERRFDLWLIDVARGVSSRFTTDPGNDRDPVWSADGLEVVYSSDASGDQNLMHKGLQGSAPAEPLPMGIGQTGAGKRDIAESWTHKGDILIYMTLDPGPAREGSRAFFTVSLKTGGKPEPLMKDEFAGDEPQVSRDGRWLAYISQESGNFEVYVEPFRRSGERIRVSTRGGGQPKWRGDGKELFYLQSDGSLMAASVREGKAGLEVGIPTVLIPARELRAVTTAADYDDYAVSSDGQRFLIKRSDDEGPRQAIHLLLEWPSLVK